MLKVFLILISLTVIFFTLNDCIYIFMLRRQNKAIPVQANQNYKMLQTNQPKLTVVFDILQPHAHGLLP